MENAIQDIRRRLRDGRYTSEAQVSQGIVQRIIRELGWDTSDTDLVYPEYPLEGLRVDFALCYPPREPLIFIEIKQVGRSEGADQQLFEYAYKKGIPVGILTDGQVWSFYLPGGQGDFSARLVYKLDLLERETEEVVQRFRRYLDYGQVRKGAARRAINDDYDAVNRDRITRRALPEAWSKLLEEKDDLLIEVVADKVQAMIDSRPDSEAVLRFLSELYPKTSEASRTVNRITPQPKSTQQSITRSVDQTRQKLSAKGKGFILRGIEYSVQGSAKNVLIAVLQKFIEEDYSFLEHFVDEPKHGSKRRYIAKRKEDLYPGRTDLAELSIQISPGWWLGTNYSRSSMISIIQLACKVARIKYGVDLIVYLD